MSLLALCDEPPPPLLTPEQEATLHPKTGTWTYEEQMAALETLDVLERQLHRLFKGFRILDVEWVNEQEETA